MSLNNITDLAPKTGKPLMLLFADSSGCVYQACENGLAKATTKAAVSRFIKQKEIEKQQKEEGKKLSLEDIRAWAEENVKDDSEVRKQTSANLADRTVRVMQVAKSMTRQKQAQAFEKKSRPEKMDACLTTAASAYARWKQMEGSSANISMKDGTLKLANEKYEWVTGKLTEIQVLLGDRHVPVKDLDEAREDLQSFCDKQKRNIITKDNGDVVIKPLSELLTKQQWKEMLLISSSKPGTSSADAVASQSSEDSGSADKTTDDTIIESAIDSAIQNITQAVASSPPVEDQDVHEAPRSVRKTPPLPSSDEDSGEPQAKKSKQQ